MKCANRRIDIWASLSVWSMILLLLCINSFVYDNAMASRRGNYKMCTFAQSLSCPRMALDLKRVSLFCEVTVVTSKWSKAVSRILSDFDLFMKIRTCHEVSWCILTSLWLIMENWWNGLKKFALEFAILAAQWQPLKMRRVPRLHKFLHRSHEVRPVANRVHGPSSCVWVMHQGQRLQWRKIVETETSLRTWHLNCFRWWNIKNIRLIKAYQTIKIS